jgi:serine/threonine protein phosphatase 1
MNENYFVLSDIHGCRKELNLILNTILSKNSNPHFIFLGDYVDRGKDSKGVVSDLIDLSKDYKCIFLKGNHEDMLLDRTLGKNAQGNRWDRNGNDATISSYGNLQNILKVHGDFYQNLKLTFETKEFLFVHGGLEPNVPLEKQNEERMLWIRHEFIDSDFDFGKIILYGHTPEFPIRIGFKKICVDTGCVYGNYLTALQLNKFEYFSVKLGDEKTNVGRLDRNILGNNNIRI